MSFTASPATSPAPGSPVTLTCSATNAISINIPGIVPLIPPTGTFTVRPTVDTTYVCTAYGSDGRFDTRSLTVKVTGSTPPAGAGPTINVTGGFLITVVNRVIRLDASATTGTGPLTFNWAVNTPLALILNPSSATPDIQLGANGDYIFTVTATDKNGVSTSANVVVRYVGP